MKKLILSSAATLAMIAGTALADVPAGCNPLVANWQNAAPYTCAESDTGGDKFKRPETEEVAATPAG